MHSVSITAACCVAGMPDLHPGKYGPVGCSILADRIHPPLMGSDIGCGMGVFELDLAVRKLRVDKAAGRLRALDVPREGDIAGAVAEAGLAPTPFDASIGAIGGGNHFCEVQAIEEILVPEVTAKTGLDGSQAYLLVHPAHEGLAIRSCSGTGGGCGIARPRARTGAYLTEHDIAVRWDVIAMRAALAVGATCSAVADLSHNLVEEAGGGVRAQGNRTRRSGPRAHPRIARHRCLIWSSRWRQPGRRRWRCLPTVMAANSIGRPCTAAFAPANSDRAKLARNPFGGMIVCEDRDLLVEEAPEAYKSIDRVIADLADFGLARVVATFGRSSPSRPQNSGSMHGGNKSGRMDRR